MTSGFVQFIVSFVNLFHIYNVLLTSGIHSAFVYVLSFAYGLNLYHLPFSILGSIIQVRNYYPEMYVFSHSIYALNSLIPKTQLILIHLNSKINVLQLFQKKENSSKIIAHLKETIKDKSTLKAQNK